MTDLSGRISLNEFTNEKDKLYYLLKNKSDSLENIKSKTKKLLDEVDFVYKEKSISDPQWLVNVSELREFYLSLDFNYDIIKSSSYSHNDRMPYQKYVQKKEYELWDRLSNRGIYSIKECDMKINEFHISRIAHYNFLYDYSDTGLFALRSLGILSYNLEFNKKGTYCLSYDGCIDIANRYISAYNILRKNKYDLEYSKCSDKLMLRGRLIEKAIKIYQYAFDRSLKSQNNRLQSIFYFHLMKTKETFKKYNVRYYISINGKYQSLKHNHDSSYFKYLKRKIFTKPDYILNTIKYLVLKSLRLLCGYGEHPYKVIISGLFTVFIFSPMYLLNGIKVNGEVINYRIDINSLPSINTEFLIDLGNSLYFSMITFTTLGYGDASPTGWSKFFASIESFFGAIFISLFIFTLARQIQR